MALQIIHQIKRMPSKGRYTAGKQVSRWEADSDNIDIEYKNLEGQQQSYSCPNCSCPLGDKKPIVIKVLTILVVFGIGLFVGYLIRKTVYSNSALKDKPPDGYLNLTDMYSIKQDYDREFSKLIQDDLEDVVNYEDHMKIITRCVHMSGMGSANKLIDYVQQKWLIFPFDAVKVKTYNVTVSYANYSNMEANVVTVQAANGSLVFQTQYNTSSSHPEYLPFSAYSPSKEVTTESVVYAHYGRREDFVELARRRVTVNGSVLIMRYGRTHPASKVKLAETHGAVGVILYSDPADYANNQSVVYPDSWWLPGWAVQLAHVRYDLVGDPLTPDYSSITRVHHIKESAAKFPRIPVQPIRYDDARNLLRDMNGPIVKNDWFGGLNITYRLGPGYTDKRVLTLQVQNILLQRNITNVIAVVKGHLEPGKYVIVGSHIDSWIQGGVDAGTGYTVAGKYVIVGSHIDSWIQGGVDAGTGYTVIQELARTFAYHIEKGWKPRRTIMFALWDASKYGNVGSYEWVQEYEKQLIAGAVAYINLDSLIQGDYSFTAASSPLLHSVIMQATQSVSLNCTFIPWCTKSSTVYDQWSRSFPSKKNHSLPRFENLGDWSDHGPFIYRIGVPVLNPQYTFSKKLYPNLPTYPAIGALEDTKEYVETFIDPSYSLHISMAKVVADLILRLSDSAVLPFDILSLVTLVNSGRETLKLYATTIQASGIDIGILMSSIDEFCRVAINLSIRLRTINHIQMSEVERYLINDNLVQLSRAFVADIGLPGQKQYRNVLIAPHPDNLHTDVIFPGVVRTLTIGLQTESWDPLGEQVSILVLSFRRATDIIVNGLISK